MACGCLTGFLLVKIWKEDIFFLFVFTCFSWNHRMSCFSGNPLQSVINASKVAHLHMKVGTSEAGEELCFRNCLVNITRITVVDPIVPHLTLCCSSWRGKHFFFTFQRYMFINNTIISTQIIQDLKKYWQMCRWNSDLFYKLTFKQLVY